MTALEAIPLIHILCLVASAALLLVATVGFSVVPLLFESRIEKKEKLIADLRIAHTEANQAVARAADVSWQSVSSAQAKRILQVLKSDKDVADVRQMEAASAHAYLESMTEAICLLLASIRQPPPDELVQPLPTDWANRARELSARRVALLGTASHSFFSMVKQTEHGILHLKAQRRYWTNKLVICQGLALLLALAGLILDPEKGLAAILME